MNKKQEKIDNPLIKDETTGVTSPITSKKLVSKVNSLTFGSRNNFLSNPQTKVFTTDKGITLDYKNVIGELIKISSINNLTEFYSKVYSIILQNIDSGFFAVGLYKEKSNCINLRLQDKLGNFYSTKVFMKDINDLYMLIAHTSLDYKKLNTL